MVAVGPRRLREPGIIAPPSVAGSGREPPARRGGAARVGGLGLPEASWRGAVRRSIGDRGAFAADVANALGEPREDVRAMVELWLLLHTLPASVADLEATIDRLRRRALESPLAAPELLPASTLPDLLALVQREQEARPLDAARVVAIQRTAGAIAARTGPRLVLFQLRLAFARRRAWELCSAEVAAGRMDAGQLHDFGLWLLVWTELSSLAVTEGYRAAEREALARAAEARRAALDELLGVITADPVGLARSRRVAARFGLDPDRAYRLAVVAPGPDADPTPAAPGIDAGDLDLLASRIGHLLGATSTASEGAGAGIRLPTVLAMRGRIVVLAADDAGAMRHLPRALEDVLGGRHGGPGGAEGSPPWVAIGSAPVSGVAPLAAVLVDLLDALRTAEAIDRHGWIPDPEALAVERLLLASRELGTAAIDRELGPLLADERLGEELIETLQVYFDSGENMRETARRMHLANRTVAYRLERIESLLGGPLDGELRRRLSVALLVRRLGRTI
jgi:hypothetical protein